MPLYEYKCQTCGAGEEKLESLAAAEYHDCPACGAGVGMKRQLSVAAVATSAGSPAMGHGGGASPCAGGSCPFMR
jgi:putative FmdB family regulatory protein